MVTNCQKIHGQNNNQSIRRITQDEKNPDRREYLLKPGVLNRLHEVARILVTNRRDRIAQNGDRWEAFCCDIRYQCSLGPNKRCQYGYDERTRHDFVEHLQRDHGITSGDEREKLIEESKNIFLDHMATLYLNGDRDRT
jgi:hypothetical protein